jgi:hypothetical protein
VSQNPTERLTRVEQAPPGWAPLPAPRPPADWAKRRDIALLTLILLAIVNVAAFDALVFYAARSHL